MLVNGTYIAPEQRATQTLLEGDVLAIWPPISGGEVFI
jgi:sulfur carrier protein ThiS